SAYHWRIIPFFAVVAGPITALNLQDATAWRYGTGLPASERGRRWALAGRSLTVLLLLALLPLVCLGKLQPPAGRFGTPRRVAWGVEPAPSLQKAARQLDEWRAAGLLPAEARGFNWLPDLACYWAWYCPDEKGFFDHRYPLFAGAAADYETVRRTLGSS